MRGATRVADVHPRAGAGAPARSSGAEEPVPAARAPVDGGVLRTLEGVSRTQDLGDLAARLAEIRGFLADDLAAVEAALAATLPAPTRVHASGRHLLSLAGKRVRPLCVALAARLGAGFAPAAAACAVAVELVHNATLLHDDVVDQGDLRRGVPTARTLYGNAASIFAGDWLLVDALGRVSATGLPDVLEALLDVLKEMLDAEAIQLERRGRTRLEPGLQDVYFRIAGGKTASLFGWAMLAGARAGGLDPAAATRLAGFGRHVGTAFQVVDDVLDLTGDAATLGKGAFADLREGKLTYPLLLGVERDPDLGRLVEWASREPGSAGGPANDEAFAVAARDVVLRLRRTEALDDALALARSLVGRALDDLATFPRGASRDALEAVALAMVERSR